MEILLDAFKNKEIEKHYLCVVNGYLKKKNDILIDYLFKDDKKSIVYISKVPQKSYVQIKTQYTVLKEANGLSLLDVNLLTGKTHQIRAHLAFIGHPIIGDGKYGINSINKKYHKKNQMLCSYLLKFKLPTNSKLSYLNNMNFHLSCDDFYKFMD